jgi:hypothetical protein
MPRNPQNLKTFLKDHLVSETLPAFLDYLRVEDHRTPNTLIRYESHIHKFIATVGDRPITDISSGHRFNAGQCGVGQVR